MTNKTVAYICDNWIVFVSFLNNNNFHQNGFAVISLV